MIKELNKLKNWLSMFGKTELIQGVDSNVKILLGILRKAGYYIYAKRN